MNGVEDNGPNLMRLLQNRRFRVSLLIVVALGAMTSTYYLDFKPVHIAVHNATTTIINEQSSLDHRDNNGSFPILHHEVNTTTKKRGIFYSETRKDRSGSAILDMIYAKAYAYRNDLEYAGACSLDYHAKGRLGMHEKLLHALGLDHEFPFQCPDKEEQKTLILAPQVYRKDAYLTPDFLNYLRRSRRRQGQALPPQNSTAKVVLHIRRGDVTPCTSAGKSSFRYTPNQLYLDVLEQQVTIDYEPNQVMIFSQSKSVESFDDFSSKQYNLRLDRALTTAWTKMADAQVLILSKSSFSRVPYVIYLCRDAFVSLWLLTVMSLNNNNFLTGLF
jgi:hypothetical protein